MTQSHAARADDAIVLRATPFGDADLVVHLLTRDSGRIGAFARGARRSSKRYSGGLEPFCVLRVEWKERRGSDLSELVSSTIEEPHLGIRAELGRLAQAGYVVELARELSRENEANGGLYTLVASMLELLSAREATPLVLRAYELQLLAAAGLAPVLDVCPRCGASLSTVSSLAFDASAGGVTCARCASPGSVPLRVEGLALLQVLARRSIVEVADATLPPALDDLRGALGAFLRHHVHHQLRSVEFLRASGVTW